MKFTKINIAITRSYNLGDYENIKLECGLEGAFAEDEGTKEHIDQARKSMLDEIANTFEEAWEEFSVNRLRRKTVRED